VCVCVCVCVYTHVSFFSNFPIRKILGDRGWPCWTDPITGLLHGRVTEVVLVNLGTVPETPPIL